MTAIKNVLVTGAHGQLGQVFRQWAPQYKNLHFIFADKATLSIADAESLTKFFAEHSVHFCINCAAYTAVDKAETEQEAALLLNNEAVKTVAEICFQKKIGFIHFSTDYVFDGLGSKPYKAADLCNPVNFYGYTKWLGEQNAIAVNPQSIIIRTSWLYSPYGKNFVKTMVHLLQTKPEISVVNDQYGCPTYAVDLGKAVLDIITANQWKAGIYHYCNEGIINWFQFAEEIKNIAHLNGIVKGISTAQYPTAAKRPIYSALETQKIQEQFNVAVPNWAQSLQRCLQKLKPAEK